MNPFAHFIAQQAAWMERSPRPSVHHVGARPDTSEELAVLAQIKVSPDAATGELADALNRHSESLYPMLQRLKRSGKIIIASRGARGNLWRAV